MTLTLSLQIRVIGSVHRLTERNLWANFTVNRSEFKRYRAGRKLQGKSHDIENVTLILSKVK